MARTTTLLLFAIMSVAAAGCDCAGPVTTPCRTSAECDRGMRCVDGMCMQEAQSGDGGETCTDGRDRCGGDCCASGRVCYAGSCQANCGAAPICGGACCGDGEECIEDACVAACADEADRCGAACCGDAQACLGGGCVDLGEPCEFTEQCEVDHFCEPTLMRCVPRDAVEVCEYRPPVGEFTPEMGCHWEPPAGPSVDFVRVVMTPAVMNMTDDNGDGATDTLDIPDVVFIASDRADGCCSAQGRLVIASGACNADGSMTTHAIVASPYVDNSSGVALGNLHPEGMTDERAPEIVATTRNGGTIAFRRTADDGSAWAVLWESPLPSREQLSSGGAPSLADLDADGQPEVIIGNVVLDGLTGAVVWNGDETVGPNAGVGNNAFLGPSSTVADLDLDGDMEVIAGNTVYDGRTGAEVWTYMYTTSNSPCHTGSGLPCDGFNAVGDFDDDPEGEVVIVRRGEVFVLNHDGTLLHQAQVPVDDTMPYEGDGPCAQNESGPPTVADFDGDGRPEVGTAGADFYTVVDFDCTGSPLPAGCERENILWTVPNRDCSSRATGSSVFDFEGDGAAEVVYADEQTFRIFDGRTGTILYEDTSHTSNTRLEMPIVVDVDNDGKSEVVVPEPNTSPSLGGIEIWEDADNNWVRTRRVWNQHAYHVTNITEDGQVPRNEAPNWRDGRLNNFRQNVQPGGLFDAPDLTITDIEVESCVPGTMEIAVTVKNQGALGVPPGIAVWGRVRLPDGTVVDLGVERTTTLLLPGRSEVVVFTWSPGGAFTVPEVTFEAIVDDDGTGAGAYNECDEDNNGMVSEPLMTCTFG